MEGWIKLHRSISEWDWSSSIKEFCLFMHILVRANHKESNWRGAKILPGQLLTGRKQLSEWTGLSEQQVRTSLLNLKTTGELTIQPTNKFSIITITKWHKYQLTQHAPTSKPTNNQPTSNHIQECNNENKLISNNQTNLVMMRKKKRIAKKDPVKVKVQVELPFLSEELQLWIARVSDTIRKKWLDRYHPDTITRNLQKAKDWADAKGVRSKNVASLMNKFFENVEYDAGGDPNSDYTGQQLVGFKELDLLTEKMIEGEKNVKGTSEF